MTLFRKKPVVIEAVQWLGITDGIAWPKWFPANTIDVTNGVESLHIQTLEGTMRPDSGDWIIKGIKGELYPCKPDIFAQTYEKVEEQ